MGWLIAHPEGWSADDLATAETLVADRKRAIDDEHPKDVRARESKQEVVDDLEAAIRAYHALPST